MKKEEIILSRNGLFRLHVVHWTPDDSPPRAVIQLVHGISEYINRYDHFARFLTANGFAVVGCDLPGHGQSIWNPDEYGYFAEEKGWMLVCKALRELAEDIRAEYPGIPFFLFGHSMGSFLTRTLMIDEPDIADGFILSGTGQPNAKLLAAGQRITELAVRLLGAKGKSARIEKMSMGAYNQQFAPARTSVDWISRDTAEVDRYAADPLCNFSPKVGLFRDMIGGLRYIGAEENMAKMDKEKPIYLFAGEDDPVGEMGVKVRQVFYAFLELGCHNVRCRLYPGGRHEMLNEINKEEVYADVLVWLERHMESP